MNKKYLGVKVVSAEPMTRNEAIVACLPRVNTLDSIRLDDDNEPGYKVIYKDVYKYWSPKDTFENAYRPIDGLTFGLAIEALKQGKKVARAGWNAGLNERWLRLCDDGEAHFGDEFLYGLNPFICETNVNSSFYGMYVPSSDDILAEDWAILEE
jgi:hypothetical protein